VSDSRLDIVIVNWNSGAMLDRCLQSIAAIDDPSLVAQVIVVDNASRDGSADRLGRHASLPIRRLRNERNLGFGKACNAGARLGSARERRRRNRRHSAGEPRGRGFEVVREISDDRVDGHAGRRP
jgi:GT2 family glycosyltransferase